jgi:hypothetical protein
MKSATARISVQVRLYIRALYFPVLCPNTNSPGAQTRIYLVRVLYVIVPDIMSHNVITNYRIDSIPLNTNQCDKYIGTYMLSVESYKFSTDVLLHFSFFFFLQ